MPTRAPSHGSPVLVAGGSGFVGGIIARSLVAAGRMVIVPSRSRERLEKLAQSCAAGPGILVTLQVSDDRPHFEAAELLAGQVRDGMADPPGAVVAALGGWSRGEPLIDLPAARWHRALQDHLTSHLEAIQAFVPTMDGAPDPVYIAVNGAAATRAMAGSGAVCVTGAAQHMLIQVMRAEPVGARVRFHELSLMAAVSGDGRNVEPEAEISPVRIGAAIQEMLADPRIQPCHVLDPGTT